MIQLALHCHPHCDAAFWLKLLIMWCELPLKGRTQITTLAHSVRLRLDPSKIFLDARDVMAPPLQNLILEIVQAFVVELFHSPANFLQWEWVLHTASDTGLAHLFPA